MMQRRRAGFLFGLISLLSVDTIGCDDGGGDSDVDAAPADGSVVNSGGQGGSSQTTNGGQGGTAQTFRDAGLPDTAGMPDADPLTEILTGPERTTIRAMSPLPAVPADTTNKYADNAAAAVLGQKFFFDKRFSGPLVVAADNTNGGLGATGAIGKISCASCHVGPGLDDRRSMPGNVSLGADYLARNSLPLVNASFYQWINWAGRFSAQWELPIAVLESGKNMNGNRLALAHVIFDRYKTEYETIFGALEPAIGTDAQRFPVAGKPKATNGTDGAWEGMAAADQKIVNTILVNFGKALQAYMRKLVSRNAPFDQLVSGKTSSINGDAIAGLKLFLGKANCVSCHSGAHFTDNAFHTLGVAQTGANVPAADLGRFTDIPSLLASPFNTAGAYSDDINTGRLANLVATDANKGQFRTPSLRGIAATGPYMHAGQFQTLDQLIDFYDAGNATPAAGTLDGKIKPLGLTTKEKQQLSAFLQTLSGEPVPASLLVDTAN